jgi:hypothetical protein
MRGGHVAAVMCTRTLSFSAFFALRESCRNSGDSSGTTPPPPGTGDWCRLRIGKTADRVEHETGAAEIAVQDK